MNVEDFSCLLALFVHTISLIMMNTYRFNQGHNVVDRRGDRNVSNEQLGFGGFSGNFRLLSAETRMLEYLLGGGLRVIEKINIRFFWIGQLFSRKDRKKVVVWKIFYFSRIFWWIIASFCLFTRASTWIRSRRLIVGRIRRRQYLFAEKRRSFQSLIDKNNKMNRIILRTFFAGSALSHRASCPPYRPILKFS